MSSVLRLVAFVEQFAHYFSIVAWMVLALRTAFKDKFPRINPNNSFKSKFQLFLINPWTFFVLTLFTGYSLLELVKLHPPSGVAIACDMVPCIFTIVQVIFDVFKGVRGILRHFGYFQERVQEKQEKIYALVYKIDEIIIEMNKLYNEMRLSIIVYSSFMVFNIFNKYS